MKTTLLIAGITLIAAPFLLLVLYALTPWEPYRGEAAAVCGFVSMILGWLSIMATLDMR